MGIRRVYDPPECDEQGVPLDWERCRNCDGLKSFHVPGLGAEDCDRCEGYGSIKAAVLWQCRVSQGKSEGYVCGRVWRPAGGFVYRPTDPVIAALTLRCESCNHPMSEGTWEYDKTPWFDEDGVRSDPAHPTAPHVRLDRVALAELRAGREPTLYGVHYSPCDTGCRHGGPLRCNTPSDLTAKWDTVFPVADADVLRSVLTAGIKVEASWRPVDIRCLGWPHDLRPEKLAVLCLRCFAERSA